MKETIAKQLNLKEVPEEEREQLLEEAEDIVLDRVLSRMMNELNEEDAQTVTALLEEEKQEEVSSIFCEKFPNMTDFFAEEIKNIQEEISNKYSKKK